MNPPSPGIPAGIASALGNGLPELLLHFVTVLILWAIGVGIYTMVTPYHERDLIERGNSAAGIVLAGAIVSIALPLAALLATTGDIIDILVWGVIAVVLQLVTMAVVSLVLRGLKRLVEADNMAGAMIVAAAQIAVALLNAAAMVPI
jgi:putative membrane protein